MARYSNLRSERAMDAIEEYIDTNGLKENDPLPAERSLTKELNLSRGTVREALTALEREGRIYKIHGKGSFVAADKYSVNIVDMQFRVAIKKRMENAFESKVVYFQTMLAGEMAAKKLQIQSEDEVYVLSRVRKIADWAILLENAYLPVKYVPGLERYDFERESLYSVLKSEYGIEIIDQRMNLQLSRASVKEAQYLGISADDVVFVEKNIARDAENRPIEYSKSILVAQYVKYQIDFDRRMNILILNELKLQMLCETPAGASSQTYAENTFDAMYWNRVTETLRQLRNKGERISFCYERQSAEDMIHYTLPFVDYAFFRADTPADARRLISRKEALETAVIIVLCGREITVKDPEGTCCYETDTSKIDMEGFQKRYLFGVARNRDKGSCMKYAVSRSEKENIQEE